MRKSGLNQPQILILVAMAAFTCLLITCMGGTVVNQTLQAGSRMAANAPGSTGVQDTSTPTVRALPPTWTPAPTATPEGMGLLFTFVPDRCTFEIPAMANVECGYVVVPETRGDPPEGIVKLAVAIYRSSSSNPAPDPVIYLAGGPGGAAVDDLARLYDDFVAPLQEERDVIIFDQRGVGLSEPELTCYEYTDAAEQDLEKNLSLEEQAEVYAAAFRRCHDRLTDRGINLAAYTSAANAADVRDIAAALGYEKVNLYGISYGTRLALTVMRDYPEILRSVILDSVEPVAEPMYNQHAARVDRLLRKIFDGCEADPACSAAYPTLEDEFYDLLDRLDRQPGTLWVKSIGEKMYQVKLDGDGVIMAIFFSSYYSNIIPYIPLMIDNANQGDFELTEWFLGFAVSTEEDLSVGMMTSINCHEEVFATTPEQIRADYDAYGHVATFAYSAVYGEPETLFAICREWGAAPFEPVEGQPVRSDVPALIIAGEYDPITPPEYGLRVAQQLSRSYYYEFPGMAHGPSVQTYCAYSMAKAFLSDPLSEPDAGCIVELEGPPFITP